MEKYRLKIKFKASTTETPTNDNSHGGNTGRPFLVAAVTETNSSSDEGFLPATCVAMKRKRGHRAGHKKGKSKKPLVVENDPVSIIDNTNTEYDSGLDDIDDCQLNSAMEIEATSPEPDKSSKLMSMDVDGLNDRPVGRVKVKLRSKVLEPKHTYLNELTQSDTDKSTLQRVLEKHGEVTENMEDGANSRSEMQATLSASTTKKAGSIKIKSSRGLGPSGAVMPEKHINKPNSPAQMQEDRTHVLLENEKIVDSSTSRESHQRETKLAHQDHQYNEKELNAALMVIKEIMKTDAAEPFNTPVNPVALGIPDYFDIIDTPMDFGTICHYLEHGLKYMNSEDVYKDVQFIWKNCYRYNSKGNYILDLMKRVKKHFRKCWMAAGLYCEPQKRVNDAALDQDSEGLTREDDHGRDKDLQEASGRKTIIMMSKKETLESPSADGRLNGSESIRVEDAAPSSLGKVYTKGGSLKQKTRKRQGINHHKSGCLCAVCILMRRRREREENARMQRRMIDGNLSQEFKQEENSPLDNSDRSPEPDAEDDMEERGDDIKLEAPEQEDSLQHEKQEMSEEYETGIPKKGNGESSEKVTPIDRTGEDSNGQSQAHEVESLGLLARPDEQKDDGSMQQQEEDVVNHEEDAEQKQAESQKRHWTKILEDPLFRENPLILQMCGTLFPNDPRSVWSGPHSFSRRPVPVRSSPIHAAVSMFMK
ncbi:transcriptional activator SPT7 [Magnolia sinica]|uniref:transcriptional activator SPT7 n=1 Tax=Magnolia sinica TaxID=86752 RepID=UPI0026586508|nr:transcriptional activator SPT7 [Magnolia sinica]XP_058097710.1 transcriptional activator SPT7 [Magnolia sinica]